MNFHWTIRTCNRAQPFLHRDASVELWTLLKERFPDVFAAVLMPNHAHWIQHLQIEDPTKAYGLLAKQKNNLSRALKTLERKWKFGFEIIPFAQLIPDQKHLLRQVRYIHLNPCRAGLCADPLEWEWSTHWDVLGLVRDPWVQSKSLFQNLGLKEDLKWFHRYVSSDPTVKVQGTPFPLNPPQNWDLGMDDLIAALAAFHRCSTREFNKKQGLRREFIHAAILLGVASRKELGKRLELAPQNVGAHLKAPLSMHWIPQMRTLMHDFRTLHALRKMDRI